MDSARSHTTASFAITPTNYNALQVALSRRLERPVPRRTYTWSKVLTTASSDTSSVRIDQYTHAAYYGAASFDVRQNFALNYVYLVPGLKNNGYLVKSLTTGCFFASPVGSTGLDSGVNWLYYPGLINFDVSAQKDISIKERAHVQLRVDAFNIFNHANFTSMNTTLNVNAYPTTNGIVTGSPTITSTALGRNANGTLNVTGFGTVTSPAAGAPGGPRVLQFVLKFVFYKEGAIG